MASFRKVDWGQEPPFFLGPEDVLLQAGKLRLLAVPRIFALHLVDRFDLLRGVGRFAGAAALRWFGTVGCRSGPAAPLLSHKAVKEGGAVQIFMRRFQFFPPASVQGFHLYPTPWPPPRADGQGGTPYLYTNGPRNLSAPKSQGVYYNLLIT